MTTARRTEQHNMRIDLELLHKHLRMEVEQPLLAVAGEDKYEVAQRLWERAMAIDTTPHLCLDPYCTCHLILEEVAPTMLPGMPPSTW